MAASNVAEQESDGTDGRPRSTIGIIGSRLHATGSLSEF
jgi:hypothetical protein